MSTRAFLGLSHTPLMGLNPVTPDVDRKLRDALSEARERVAGFAPQLIVLIAPDHYNGFFNEMMPPFCIGTEATSVGDYLTPAGPLNVDEVAAVQLASWLMDDDFDVALSRRMRVDHGFSQPLQLLFGGLDTPPVIPIFLNAVAQPGIPRLRRCKSLGDSMARHFRDDPRRILFIGSGGLSHEPPVPTLADPDPTVRARITERQNPTAQERDAKTQRVMAAGMSLAKGQPGIKPLNPDWDDRWMTALSGGAEALDQLCALSEASISEQGGRSAHESKTWLIARSALGTAEAPACRLRHYQAIPEYIAGFGILFLENAD